MHLCKGNGADPPKRDGRYYLNGNFKDARLRKSRRPLQIQTQRQTQVKSGRGKQRPYRQNRERRRYENRRAQP